VEPGARRHDRERGREGGESCDADLVELDHDGTREGMGEGVVHRTGDVIRVARLDDGDDDHISGRACRLLDSLQCRGVSVPDRVPGEDGHGRPAPADEGLRRRVGAVAELGDGGLDFDPQLVAHADAARKHARDRGEADPGLRGDVDDPRDMAIERHPASLMTNVHLSAA